MNNTKYTDLRVAEVQILDFETLRDDDGVKKKRLFDACCKDDFFILTC